MPLAAQPKRLALAALAAVVLLTGVLNAGAVFGDGAERAAWEIDPAARSATDTLVGAPERAPSRLDDRIRDLQDRLREDPGATRAATQLGHAYLQKTRDTGDPAYYPKAEALFARALKSQPDDVEALVGMGALALARHRFLDALDWGERARDTNPHHAAAHGVVGDALLEIGRYDEAFASFQRMVDLRPDLNSYARVAYARELVGDRAGAIRAMEQAAVAGSAVPENAAWALAQLGALCFGDGDLDGAERRYRQALATFPDYVHATAGLARVAAARGDDAAAVALYEDALARMPLPEFAIALGDLHRAHGRTAEAAAQDALVDAMRRLAAENGVETDLELARFDADRGQRLPDAIAAARARLAEGPSIAAAGTLAWALYRSGDLPGAKIASDQALRLGTDDPVLRFHAGLIARDLGDHATARVHLEAALARNPHFSPLYAPQARDALAALGLAAPAPTAAALPAPPPATAGRIAR